METWIANIVLVTVFSIIGWLLSNKDKKQADEIDKLFALLKENADKLAALQLYIAGQHYERKDLDAKFGKLEHSIAEGFKLLSVDIKEMTKAFNEHVKEERRAQ